jgi:hypothetical protein
MIKGNSNFLDIFIFQTFQFILFAKIRKIKAQIKIQNHVKILTVNLTIVSSADQVLAPIAPCSLLLSNKFK